MIIEFDRGFCTESSTTWPRLLGDIGGTNARFAWQVHEGAPIDQVMVMSCADHSDVVKAVEHYLTSRHLHRPKAVALGMAVPVVSDFIELTNNHWKLSIKETRAALEVPTLLVLNDFTALALAIPGLEDKDKHQIGTGNPRDHAPIGLIGPGTGLGVSGLMPVPGLRQWVPIAGEGGHVSLSASNPLEFAVVEYLNHRYGHASAERVLSGSGLVDLFHALAHIRGESPGDVATAAEVIRLSQRRDSLLAESVLDLFCGWLGSVAGDLALTLGARGGIYVGGGIVPRIREQFSQSQFRHRFEAKGRYQAYLADIPTWFIDAAVSPALLGASRALSWQLSDSFR